MRRKNQSHSRVFRQLGSESRTRRVKPVNLRAVSRERVQTLRVSTIVLLNEMIHKIVNSYIWGFGVLGLQGGYMSIFLIECLFKG